jgi:hypothetical protein
LSRHRYDPSDPEVQLRRRHDEPGWEGLSLFAGDASAQAWPESAAAATEQREIPLDGTIEQRYQAWRATPEGTAAFQWIAGRATSMVAQGATRLSIAQLVEGYRFNERASVNNTYRAPMVRELEDRYPILRGLFEARVRRSA